MYVSVTTHERIEAYNMGKDKCYDNIGSWKPLEEKLDIPNGRERAMPGLYS